MFCKILICIIILISNGLFAFKREDVVKVVALDFQKLFEGKENDDIKDRLYKIYAQDLDNYYPKFDRNGKIFLYVISGDQGYKTLMAVPTNAKDDNVKSKQTIDTSVKILHDGFFFSEKDSFPHNAFELSDEVLPNKFLPDMLGDNAIESVTFAPDKMKECEFWDHMVFSFVPMIFGNYNGENTKKIDDFNENLATLIDEGGFKTIKSSAHFSKGKFSFKTLCIPQDGKSIASKISIKTVDDD